MIIDKRMHRKGERERESLRVMPRCVKLVHFMCQHSPVGKFVTRFDSDTYAAFFPAYLPFSHLISSQIMGKISDLIQSLLVSLQ